MEGFIFLVVLVVLIILMDTKKKKDEKRKIENDLKKEKELANNKGIEKETINSSKQDNTDKKKKDETHNANHKKGQELDQKEKELETLKRKYFERKRKYPFELSVEEKNKAFTVKTKGIISGPINRDIDVKFTEQNVYVRGLKDGETLVNEAFVGKVEGLKVKISQKGSKI